MSNENAKVSSDERFQQFPLEFTDDVTCLTVRDGKLAVISTPHEGGGAAICITVEDARFIRNWLNKVLP